MSRVTGKASSSQTAVEINSIYLPISVSDGSVFYEIDTNKSYVLYDGSWSEL